MLLDIVTVAQWRPVSGPRGPRALPASIPDAVEQHDVPFIRCHTSYDQLHFLLLIIVMLNEKEDSNGNLFEVFLTKILFTITHLILHLTSLHTS